MDNITNVTSLRWAFFDTSPEKDELTVPYLERLGKLGALCQFNEFTMKDALLYNLLRYKMSTEDREEIFDSYLDYDQVVKFSESVEEARLENGISDLFEIKEEIDVNGEGIDEDNNMDPLDEKGVISDFKHFENEVKVSRNGVDAFDPINPIMGSKIDKNGQIEWTINSDGKIKQVKLREKQTSFPLCELCTRTKPFKTLKAFQGHQRRHKLDNLTFPCDECSKVLGSPNALKNHKRIHNQSLLLACDVCPQKCHSVSSLKEHKLTHNSERTLFPCDECSKLLTSAQSLKYHKRRHTGEKEFLCDHCSRTFFSKYELKLHKLNHAEPESQETAFQCDQCSQYCISNTALVFHMKKHSGVKEYICDQCPKTFLRQFYLNKHMNLHTGEKRYSCKFCSKSFLENGSRTKHERIHTGEKPYSCHLCPKTFSQKNVLDTHVRSIHTGEKPFSCSVCAKTFSCSSNKIAHEKAHRGIKRIKKPPVLQNSL